MGISVNIPSFPVEIIFALAAVFLFFAPIFLEWDYLSYLGCFFFAGLALATVKLRQPQESAKE